MDEQTSHDSQSALTEIVNATNLPSTLKGKAQRVFLRFLAGSLAHPYVREVRQNLDDMDARSRINMLVAEEIGRQAVADPLFIERAKARLFGETIQKQENLEAVLVAANQKIEEHGGEDVASSNEEEPSQDWINSFNREAELASSDELRERLAGILAGEIKNPGSFSRSTLRIISEMDQELLSYFNNALKNRFSDAILSEESWNTGDMFAIGVALEHAALISGVEGLIHKEVLFDGEGVCFLTAESECIIIRGEPNTKKQLSCWLITKVGQQISNLLDGLSPIEQLELAARRLDKSGVSTIHLGRMLDGGSLVSNDRQLWPEPIHQDLATNVRFGFGPPSLDPRPPIP